MAAAEVSAVRLFPGGHDYHLMDADAQPLLAALADADATVLLDARNDRGQGFSYEDVAEVCNRYRAPGADRPGLEVVITRVSPTMGDFSGLEELVDAV